MTIAEGMMISNERYEEIDNRVEELMSEIDSLSHVIEKVTEEIQGKVLGDTHIPSEYEREIALLGYSVGTTVMARKASKNMALMSPLMSVVAIICSKGKAEERDIEMLRLAYRMMLDSRKDE